jgi:Type II secretion system (T2SS), protein E, N-terminal domain
MSTPLKERPDAPLGTLIFRAGLLPAETIENALEEGVKTGRRLGEILIERGLIKEEDLTRLLAGQKGLPYISVRERTVDPEAARLLAEDQARLFNALPIGFEDGVPVIALADPTNEILNRNIREALGQEARFVVAARSELNDMITEVFSGPAEPAPAPLTVDTSIPPADSTTEPGPAFEQVAHSEAEPAVGEAEPEPEPEPAVEYDAPAHEPEPVPEAQPEPALQPVPEADPEPEPVEPAFEPPAPAPAAAAPAYEPPAEPHEPAAEPPQVAAEPEAKPYEAPEEPEPLMAPLATEPVAQQTVQQSNGDVPHDFEDDSPPPAPDSGAGFRVSIRLTSGERMTVTECAELGEAKGYAKALTKQLGATDGEDWPFVNGRFLKPDTIVSVDVEEI